MRFKQFKLSLNAVIRRSNIPSTACQWLQYVLSLLNYGLIPLTHMSWQKNSEEGYGVLQQQVSTVSSKNYWYYCRSRIGSFWGFNFLTYVIFYLSVTWNRKCRCFSSYIRHGFCIIYIYSWKLFRMPIAVSTLII